MDRSNLKLDSNATLASLGLFLILTDFARAQYRRGLSWSCIILAVSLIDKLFRQAW